MSKVMICLTFDAKDGNKAKEAADFYVSTFQDTKILDTNPMTTVLLLKNEIKILLLNGPQTTKSYAVSIMVHMDKQEEIDACWSKLSSNGGEEMDCGWVFDKFGVCWQIIPTILQSLLSHPDEKVSGYAMNQMQTMKKLVIKDLQK